MSRKFTKFSHRKIRSIDKAALIDWLDQERRRVSHDFREPEAALARDETQDRAEIAPAVGRIAGTGVEAG
jgi:hypothetical protein